MSSKPSTDTGNVAQAGERLADRYEVIRELGRGGMGVVYLCRDLVTTEKVALKRLRSPDETKAASREEESWWFQQEARAVASLDHPAIVRARDFGMLPDGSPYLVMDALPGRSVHEWMHTTTIPWAVIWATIDQVLAGLGHAHSRGIIHGDMKPSNVMIDLSAPRGPRAYILDLGLAWLRETLMDPRLDGAAHPDLAMHAGAGTVGWVAPEQIRRAATHVGPPTDLYALGCILYRILVGHEVFEGAAQEVLRAHKRTPVVPPVLPEGVPGGVAAFVVRLLEKKPWQRFELAADARAAWAEFRPKHVATMEETLAAMPVPTAAPSSIMPEQGRAVAAARSLAPGLLSLRPSPMVARQSERDRLLGICKVLAESPAGDKRMVTLVGPAGVGKSRLAEWLCEYALEHGTAWVLRARYGKIPTALDGLTGAINKFYNLQGADRALVEQTLINRWEVSKTNDAELAWVSATAEWLRPTPPGDDTPLGPTGKRFILDNPELRYTVIRRVLERIAHDRLLLIWTDDLHYASQNTFDVLSRLQRESTVRCLLVATAREEALEADAIADRRMRTLADEWNADIMRLNPLADEETHVLLRATLPLHQDAIRAATRQSRGNPLFALQLVHAWAGGGYLRMEAGRYRVPPEALAGRAITTAELWDERLRGLNDNLRGVAYAAAALGDDVRGVVLKALAQSLGMDPRESLSALTRAQILLATGVDQYRWAHALLQEHLLARLHERDDAKAVFRAAADALALHPMIGSRRIMKHRVLNLARAGEDEMAARLMLRFVEGAWSRGRDTTATLKDLKLVEGRVTGVLAAEHAYWMAEALRHTGKLEEAKVQGQNALAAFREFHEVKREANCLRLLGHIASDMGQPMKGRELVAEAIRLSTEQGDTRGRARAMVVIGEIDVLLGEHVRASKVLEEAERACAEAGDELARGQGLILNAMIAMGRGRFEGATHLLVDARIAFDAIGYRLGIAQCETVLAHADHRGRRFSEARTRALSARTSFRELTNPRGEAACERLLAFVAFDEDDFATSSLHASVAERIYDKLADPWGLLESRLLLAQIALGQGEISEAMELTTACAYIHTDEAEPRQHRHLTQAWLAREQGRWNDAAEAITAARDTYPDPARCGDHTPFLMERLRALKWQGSAAGLVDAWASALNDLAPALTL